MSGVRRFLSDTMVYGVTTIVSRLLSFILTPLLVRKYTVGVYGIFTNLYAFASLINAVLAFGMETTFFRYLQSVDNKDRQKVFDSSFAITLFTSALFLILSIFFSNDVANWLTSNGKNIEEYSSFVKLFAFILSADALAVIPFSKLRVEGKAKRFAALKLFNISCMVLITLLLIFWLPILIPKHPFLAVWTQDWYRPDWIGNVFKANLISSSLTLLLLAPECIQFRFKIDGKMLQKMLAYSFPILIANLSFIINENLDKMIFPKLIPGITGEIQLGIYGAVAKLAVFLNLFVTAFRLGAEPFFFSYAKNENAKQTYAMIMEYFVIAMVIIMVGICANLDWLKYFINAADPEQQKAYWSGLLVVPLLLFNYVLLGIYMNLTVWYKLSDNTRYAIYISGVGATATIILNILLIPRYSYLGAAICTTVAYFIMLILSYFWGRKYYSIPYPVKKILIYLFAGFGLSYSIYYLLDLDILWSNVLLIIFCLCVYFLERKNLKKYIGLAGRK